MKPMEPLDFGDPWWPREYGQPSTSGAQNDLRYAFFPDARRLVVEDRGARTTYDTADHRIGGVSQQQSQGHALAFTSQHGPVALHQLAVVEHPAARESSTAGSNASAASSSGSTATSRPKDAHAHAEHASKVEPAHDRAPRPGPAGERTVFSEGDDEGGSVKVVVQGRLGEDLLEALEDFVRRQRKRLDKLR